MLVPLACAVICLTGLSVAYPVTQPIYQPVYQQQAVQAAPIPQYYRQPVYLAAAPQQSQAHPVFEAADPQAQQPQYVPQAQQLSQPLLGNVDRQVQKAATHIAGPSYAQQIQALQLQNQAQQAQVQIQRNALRVTTAPRAQPQYQRALQQPSSLAQGGGQPEEELQEDYNSNPSYQFGFDVKDDLYTNYQNRKEQREGDKITGSYSVVDSDGYIRTVTYTADPKQGFKAEVTRQPTDIVVKIPQPQPQHQQQQQQQQLEQQLQQARQQPQYAEIPASSQAIPDQEKQQRIIYQYQ